MNQKEQEEKIGCLLLLVIVIAVALAFKQMWLAITIVVCTILHLLIEKIKIIQKGKKLDADIKLFPYNVDLYNERATLSIRKKNYKKALDDYTKVINLNSFNPAESYANRAYVYYLMREYQLSIKDYNKAIEYQPQCATWYYNRSLAYIECKNEGSYKEAIIDLNTAYDLKNNTKISYNIKNKHFFFSVSDIKYNRGFSYYMLNKPYCAIEDLRDLSPKYRNKKEAECMVSICDDRLQPILEAAKKKQKDYWFSLDGWEFEDAVADVFRKQGYNVEVTKGSGDGGVDIVLEYGDDYRAIIQCKHYSNPVPPEPVRALWGCRDEFAADDVILVASNGVTQSGQEFIDKRSNFKLYTLDDIISMSINKDESYTEFITETRWYATQPPQNKPNLDINIQIKVDDSFSNNNVTLKYFLWERDKDDNYVSKENKLSVKIPNNFKYGTKLKCTKEGNIDTKTGTVGDLYLILSEESNILIESAQNNKIDKIDKELNKFNWGAFLLPAIWMLGNGCQDILGFCLILGIIMNLLYKIGVSDTTGVILYVCLSIYMGIKGNHIAWDRNKYDNIEDFIITQKMWRSIILILVAILGVLIIVCQINS